MTHNDSKSQILSKIRASLKRAVHIPPAPQGALPEEAVPAERNVEALAARFEAELRAVGGVFERVPAGEAGARVAALLREREVACALAWEAEHLPAPGVHAALRQAGIEWVRADLPHDEPTRSQALARLEAVPAGITGAHAALADTGTLVLLHGPGRPRLASLSVRTHVALIRPGDLYASWAAAMAAGVPALRAPHQASNVTLVTGPSRTGDIEMTLTVGVHGPGEVIVILVD